MVGGEGVRRATEQGEYGNGCSATESALRSNGARSAPTQTTRAGRIGSAIYEVPTLEDFMRPDGDQPRVLAIPGAAASCCVAGSR